MWHYARYFTQGVMHSSSTSWRTPRRTPRGCTNPLWLPLQFETQGNVFGLQYSCNITGHMLVCILLVLPSLQTSPITHLIRGHSAMRPEVGVSGWKRVHYGAEQNPQGSVCAHPSKILKQSTWKSNSTSNCRGLDTQEDTYTRKKSERHQYTARLSLKAKLYPDCVKSSFGL